MLSVSMVTIVCVHFLEKIEKIFFAKGSVMFRYCSLLFAYRMSMVNRKQTQTFWHSKTSKKRDKGDV